MFAQIRLVVAEIGSVGASFKPFVPIDPQASISAPAAVLLALALRKPKRFGSISPSYYDRNER
jgi:hypothetical protein